MSDITIGRLSDATGVKIETIRYYEKIGIMPKRHERVVVNESMALPIVQGLVSSSAAETLVSR